MVQAARRRADPKAPSMDFLMARTVRRLPAELIHRYLGRFSARLALGSRRAITQSLKPSLPSSASSLSRCDRGKGRACVLETRDALRQALLDCQLYFLARLGLNLLGRTPGCAPGPRFC